MVQIGISSSKLIPIKTHLVGTEGSDVLVKGALKLPTIMKTFPKYVLLQQNFMVIDIVLTYNAILG